MQAPIVLSLLRVVERRAISPRRIYAPAVLRRPLNDLGGAINVGCPAFRPHVDVVGYVWKGHTSSVRLRAARGFGVNSASSGVVGRVLELAGSG